MTKARLNLNSIRENVSLNSENTVMSKNIDTSRFEGFTLSKLHPVERSTFENYTSVQHVFDKKTNKNWLRIRALEDMEFEAWGQSEQEIYLDGNVTAIRQTMNWSDKKGVGFIFHVYRGKEVAIVTLKSKAKNAKESNEHMSEKLLLPRELAQFAKSRSDVGGITRVEMKRGVMMWYNKNSIWKWIGAIRFDDNTKEVQYLGFDKTLEPRAHHFRCINKDGTHENFSLKIENNIDQLFEQLQQEPIPGFSVEKTKNSAGENVIKIISAQKGADMYLGGNALGRKISEFIPDGKIIKIEKIVAREPFWKRLIVEYESEGVRKTEVITVYEKSNNNNQIDWPKPPLSKNEKANEGVPNWLTPELIRGLKDAGIDYKKIDGKGMCLMPASSKFGIGMMKVDKEGKYEQISEVLLQDNVSNINYVRNRGLIQTIEITYTDNKGQEKIEEILFSTLDIIKDLHGTKARRR